MPEPLDTSASQALASRAKMEYRATHVVARQTDEFFTTVHSLAMRDREYLSAGAVHALWEELVRPEALYRATVKGTPINATVAWFRTRYPDIEFEVSES